jgi:DNA (cytosine-5)-methyltransferase 1
VGFKVIDVFAGCGGLSYGFQMAGFEIVLGIDNDKDCAETFRFNHSHSKYLVKNAEDVSEVEVADLIGNNRIDVIIGGPPCQGFSLSGKRYYFDPRNQLYLHFFRIIDSVKPKAVVIENVPGLKGLYGGKAFDGIMNEFKTRGFSVSYNILNADDYGVPQTRKRIFFVGLKNGIYKFPKPHEKKVTLEEALDDLPLLVSELESTIYDKAPQNHFQQLMRANSNLLHNHVATNHANKTKQIIAMVPEGKNYKSLPTELQSTRKVHIAWTRLDSSKPSLTIDTGHRHHFHPKVNRVPTVRESARIQSFPDNFVFLGSKTSQYRQVGNAVPPLLAYELARELKRSLENATV